MQAIVNQLVYFGYLQCIFLLLIYLFSSSNRKNINVYLAIFIIVLMIGLSGRVLYLSEIFGADNRLVVFSEMATLLFGATIFLFTRSSLLGKAFAYSDLVHYLPAIVYNVFVTYVFIIHPEYGRQFWLIMTFLAVGLIVNITYWFLSLRIFLTFREKMKNELSFAVKNQFFLNFLIAIGICLACWLALYISGLFGFGFLTRTAWQVIWFSIAIIILFIAYYGMKAPELYKVSSLQHTKKYAKSKFSNLDLDELKNRLEKLMEEKKPYLNRKLLKTELANMLGVSNPEIARLLNERIGMNFFEYINYYRIKEFVALAKTNKAKELTLFGLAQEAGFNSKTTFNKSFKALMGTTPKDYFSKHSA